MLMLNTTAVGSGGATASARTDSQDAGSSAGSAITLLAGLYSKAVDAFGSQAVRGTYEQSISAREWQPPSEGADATGLQGDLSVA